MRQNSEKDPTIEELQTNADSLHRNRKFWAVGGLALLGASMILSAQKIDMFERDAGERAVDTRQAAENPDAINRIIDAGKDLGGELTGNLYPEGAMIFTMATGMTSLLYVGRSWAKEQEILAEIDNRQRALES